MTLPQKEKKCALSEYFRTDFEQIPRSHDFHIALQLCALPVADNSQQQRDQEDIISAQSMWRSSHPARRDKYRTVRNADGQPDVSAGKGWDG